MDKNIKVKSFLEHFQKIIGIIIILFFILIIFFYITLTSLQQFSIKTFEESEINNFKYVVKSKIAYIKKTVDEIFNDSIKKERIHKKNILNNNFNIITSIYLNGKKAGYSDNMIKKIIKEVLGKIKFGQDEYFYIQNINGIRILYSAFPSIVGKNILISPDCKGRYFVKDIINKALREGEGTLKYCYAIKKGGKIIDKETFFKLFRPYNWILGITFNYEIFYNKLKKNVLNTIMLQSIPEFGGIAVIGKDGNLILSNSKIKNINYKDIENPEKYIFKSFKVDKFSWKIVYFLDKNIILQGIKKAEISFTKNFIKKLYAFIFFLLIALFLLIKYVLKLSRNYNFQLNDLKNSIRERKNHNKHYNVKEYQDIYKTFSTVLSELQNEKSLTQAILDSINMGLFLVDNSFEIIFSNKETEKITGFSNNELSGRDFFELLKPYCIIYSKQKLLSKETFLNLMKEHSFKFEFLYIISKNGKAIPARILISSLMFNEKQCFIIAFSDETEKLERATLLNRLFTVSEHAPFSILITDVNRKIIYANPFLLNHYGYSFDELNGKSPKIFATEHNTNFYNELKQQLDSKQFFEGVFLNKKKDGTTFWEHIYIVPVKNEEGNIISYIAYKEDITEKKLIEEQLKQAKEKAETANKVKSEFLANMSHEIRTPMNAIMGFVDILLDTKLEETQKEYLEIVKDSTEKLLRILNDILDISKFEADKLEFENRALKIKTLINNSSNIFSSKIFAKGLDFKISIDENIPEYFIGDEVRITQVINNLLSNAIKFTEKGSITLKCTLIAKDNEKALIEVSISDTGVGVPKDRKEKIFEAFSQADGSITRKFGGTGLGLTIASKIVKQYNGKIWLESEENKGSTFYFTLELPIAKKIPEHENMQQEEIADINASSVKILVAEDNETNQLLIKEILKTMGIDTTIAENGLEAIKVLSENNYDLIFMDWHMPVMDGVETLEILRKIEKNENIENDKVDRETIEKLKGRKFTVIALTAAALKSEKELLIAKGFDDYLSKPFKQNDLNEILQKYVEKKIKDSKNKKFLTKENMDYIKELIGNDKELIKTLLDSFRDTFDNSLDEMEKAVIVNDFDYIKKVAHSLKGASSSLGFDEITEMVIKIENNAKIKHSENIKKLLSKLRKFSI